MRLSLPALILSASLLAGHAAADDIGCDAEATDHCKMMQRIVLFHDLVAKGDAAALRHEFGIKMPAQKKWRDAVSQSDPQDPFCNWQGCMLADGRVWFDDSGKVKRINIF